MRFNNLQYSGVLQPQQPQRIYSNVNQNMNNLNPSMSTSSINNRTPNISKNFFPSSSNMTLPSNFSNNQIQSNFNSGSTFNMSQYLPQFYTSQGYILPQNYQYQYNHPYSFYNQQYPSSVSINDQTGNSSVNKSSKTSSKKMNSSKNKLKFNSNINYESFSEEEINQAIPFMCKEQAGCRFLQAKISENP